MRLYYAMGIHTEWALWANNQKEARSKLEMRTTPQEILDQTQNGNLKKIITDKSKVYFRPMDDTSEWKQERR